MRSRMFRAGGQVAENAGDLGWTAFATPGGALVGTYTGPITESLHLADVALHLCAGDTGVGLGQVGNSVHDFAYLGRAGLLVVSGSLGAARESTEAACSRTY